MKGKILNESNEAYHSNECISFSNLKLLLESPELFKKHIDGLLPKEEKDEWRIGNYVHCKTLEPEKASKYRLTSRYYNGAKKSGKKFKRKVSAAGCELLNAKNSAIAKGCCNALKSRPDVMELFDHGEGEVTWRLNGDLFGVQCRTDWFCDESPVDIDSFGIKAGQSYALDLKTTADLDAWFSDSIYRNPLLGKLFYAGQEAFYRPIIDCIRNKPLDKWLFVVVEKSEPFRVAVIKAPSDVLKSARNKIEITLDEIAGRMKDNDWETKSLKSTITPEINL